MPWVGEGCNSTWDMFMGLNIITARMERRKSYHARISPKEKSLTKNNPFVWPFIDKLIFKSVRAVVRINTYPVNEKDYKHDHLEYPSRNVIGSKRVYRGGWGNASYGFGCETL